MGMINAKKFYAILFAALSLVMILLPAVAVQSTPSSKSGKKCTVSGETFRVKLVDSDKIVKVSRDDYLFGVVAAEMGPSYKPEALKAQSVAAYTFALFRKKENAKNDYDVTNDSSTDQAYVSRSDWKKKWGKQYDKYAKIIDSAISDTAGYVMTDDNGNPILAAYHAISSGRTESAKNVWGTDYSYLQPCESIGDLLSPDYLSIRTFTAAEIAEKLADTVQLSGDAVGWLGEVNCTESGTVITANFGGTAISGASLRDKLGLHSASFDISYADGKFTFNVKGRGHGVGMSQYGANYLAATGSTFVEILSHYYTGCKMSR